MRKSQELAFGTSCLNKAADDEPLFVLRANDELAPDAVEKWAFEYAKKKVKINGGFMSGRQVEKFQEALACANSMRVWKKENP